MTTRRSFLAASTAAAAGAFISKGASAADVATTQLPAKWDAETDVLVAGSGIAGMSAAISALDKGAKVLVMEKGKNYGGCAIINGGIIALGGGTRTQKEHGVEDSPEKLYKKLTNPAHHEYRKNTPELVKKYFGKCIPSNDNKFSALNTAAWSGGSFVYVPKGVHVDIPLQAYFRINTPNMGQFERTLIIADEGSYVHYVEGCTAPIYSTDSLHSGVVEIFVEPHARVRYTTVQNWSNNVYNLVTQRAYVREGGTMEWVDGNIGSKATMKYPACILAEPYAKASTMSLGFAGKGQYQDTGAKMIHLAPHTSSTIVAKSISRGGGRSAYRGLVKIVKGAEGSSNSTVCDALLVDEFSRSDTYPHVDVREDNVSMAHEATVSKVSEDQLFYLMSRGLSEDEAMGMIVRGFVEPISRELPMEYALELNRLVELQMEGSVG